MIKPMYDPPKKLSILYILDILSKETNRDHPISQAEIIHLLERDYNLKIERKSISRNIETLKDAGYEIEYDGGYFMAERDFEYGELRLLIDSVLFSKNIPRTQCRDLLKKVAGLTDRHFDARVSHISTMPTNKVNNRQIFFIIETIDEAITRRKKITFFYNEYRTDKKLHRKREQRYTVSPYQIAATGGRYYLICSTEGHSNFSHYRLDHMEDIQITDERILPLKEITGSNNALDLPKHMAEHIYMFSGETVRVNFRASLKTVDQIIDWFGADVTFSNETGDTVDVSVLVNESAMFCWLMQYGVSCEVLSPPSLRENIKNAVRGMAEKYGV